ncbi:MAG TPA: DUF2911 domain-containing protein [Gemmatimonadaceae bacterium]|nr:DUF2911 domain-containing protein [Gemmatimonadaceae bacterium]
MWIIRSAAPSVAVLTLVLAAPSFAQSAVLTLPDVSQHARTTQRVGLTDLTIDYSRPLVAGRKIFGGLQPYGEVWRAGANRNTTFETTDTVSVEGHVLPRGIYGVHMIPGPSSWTVIFSRNFTSWGSFTYDSTEDALRVTVQPRSIPHQEVLTYSFDDPTPTSVILTMRWDDVAVPLTIAVDVPRLVARSLRNQLRGRAITEWQAYAEVANYLMANSLSAQEALADAEQSIQLEDRFENEITKARALRLLGRAADADAAQTRAIALGDQPKVYAFARGLQRVGDQQAAMEIFRSDMRKHPGTWMSHLEAARIAVAGHDFDTAASELTLGIASAPAGIKTSIQQLLAEVHDRVDINR